MNSKVTFHCLTYIYTHSSSSWSRSGVFSDCKVDLKKGRDNHHFPKFRDLTNPLSGCQGQVKNFAGQVKYFLTCPEKCMRYIGKTKEIQYFVAEVLYWTSRSNFDLSSPEFKNSCYYNLKLCIWSGRSMVAEGGCDLRDQL